MDMFRTFASFLVAILLSWAGLAMQPHQADATSASSIEKEDTQTFLLQFAHAAANLSVDRYRLLVEELEEHHPDTPYYDDLLKLLTKSKNTTHRIEIKFWSNSWLKNNGSQLLFHGTNATREILNTGVLKASTAKCGNWGIFFGRSFSDSYAYSTPYSSNINHTWSMATPSVMVLKKDPSLSFEFGNVGWADIVQQYLLRQPQYDLTNIIAIYFKDEKNAEKIIDEVLHKSHPKIDVYVEDYHPLKTAETLSALKNVLHDHQNQWLQESRFLACYARFFPEIFFAHKHLVDEVLRSLKNIDKRHLYTMLTSAIKAQSDAIFDIVLNHADPEDIVASDYYELTLGEALDDGTIETLRKLLKHISPVLPKAAEKIEKLWSGYALTTTDPEKLGLLAETFSNFPYVQKILLLLQLNQNDVDVDFFTTVLLRSLPIIKKENGKRYALAPMVAEKGKYNLLHIIAQHAPESMSLVNQDSQNVLYYLAQDKNALEYFNDVLAMKPQMLEQRDRHKSTVAHVAAESNNLEALKVIAQKAPHLFSHVDINKSTPLHNAAGSRDDVEAVKLILQSAPDSILLKDRFDWTPIITAANSNNHQVLEYFIKEVPELVKQNLNKTMECIQIHKHKECRVLIQTHFPTAYETFKSE